MKITLTLLFIVVTTFSGRPGLTQIKPNARIIYAPIVLEIKPLYDSASYFIEANKMARLTPLLIAKLKNTEKEKEKLDIENARLQAEIKKLKAEIVYLIQTNDTIILRDTIYKKRKFLQIFKN